MTGLTATANGFVRDPFPGNRVPTGRLDPNALRLMQLYPEPNQSGLQNNYVVNRNTTDDTHSFDVRVDHNFSGNDRLFARYSFSNNTKVRPSPFDGDADGGGFGEGNEDVRVHGFAASHTHMFSPTLINEARVGFSREHTNRLQPNGDDTSDLPGRYGILGVPQLAGNGGLPALRPSNLTQLGHDGWVVSERFSNTLQFSDNLTKVAKSHTFKGGYIYQDIFFGSTQPPHRARRVLLDGRYTSVVNNTDTSTARAQFLLQQVAASVARRRQLRRRDERHPRLAVRRRGRVQELSRRLRAGHAGASSPKLTVNARRAVGLLQPRTGTRSGAGQHGTRPAREVSDPGRVARQDAVGRASSTISAKDNIQLVYTDEFGSGLGPMPKSNIAPARSTPRYQLTSKQVLRARLRPVLRRVRKPRRQPEPRLQLSVPVHAAVSVAGRRATRTAWPDNSLVDLTARQRIVLDPVNVNANGLNMRGVEFDYKTPRYHNYNVMLQTELGSHHSVEAGYVGTRGRNLETFTSMNNIQVLLPHGHQPAAVCRVAGLPARFDPGADGGRQRTTIRCS